MKHTTTSTTTTSESASTATSAPAAPWRLLRTPEEVSAAILDLVERKGASRYDEVVTQREHALQCGAHAMAAGASNATITAAFLHDIGHLLLDEHDERGNFLDQDLRHENVGARFLANWFGEDVLAPVRLHVPAKRFLCATDDSYATGLSAASVRSLEVQGGPMSHDEVAAFSELPGHAEAVDLRIWDDLAKTPGAPTPSLEMFGQIMIEVLAESA